MTDIDAEMTVFTLCADARTLASAPVDKLVKQLPELHAAHDWLASAIQRAEAQVERDMELVG